MAKSEKDWEAELHRRATEGGVGGHILKRRQAEKERQRKLGQARWIQIVGVVGCFGTFGACLLIWPDGSPVYGLGLLLLFAVGYWLVSSQPEDLV